MSLKHASISKKCVFTAMILDDGRQKANNIIIRVPTYAARRPFITIVVIACSAQCRAMFYKCYRYCSSPRSTATTSIHNTAILATYVFIERTNQILRFKST